MGLQRRRKWAKQVPLFLLLAGVALFFNSRQLLAADAIADPYVIQGMAMDLAIDTAGNRYVTGIFSGTVDFNPFVGADLKTSVLSSDDVYITRFNADGSYAWTQIFGGSAHEASFSHLIVNAGTVYVTGGCNSSDAGIGGSGSVINVGGTDCFILALDATNGAPVSGFGVNGVEVFGGTTTDLGLGLAATIDTLYVVGQIYRTNAGFNGTGTVSSVAFNKSSGFILALDLTTGAPKPTFGGDGARIFGGTTGGDYIEAATVSATSLYVCGAVTSADATLDGVGSVQSLGASDAIVLALDPVTGALQPSFGVGGFQAFCGTNDEWFLAVRVAGNLLYLAGSTLSTDGGIG
ncbi:MAG TPA: hypothetical protein VL860_14350, partial [Planctomycetota bacterium]|nr:hypothetical protein [Planctomycetota bacterium]